ncbi:uncharacterized protein LOC134454470 isoform X2 [Engraulis encrasicolus]
MILGNGLAKSLVWPDVPANQDGECSWEPNLLPFCDEDSDDIFHFVSPATIVTRAAARAERDRLDLGKPLVPLSHLHHSLTREQLLTAQMNDSSLRPLFDKVKDIQDSGHPHGYFVNNGILLRKYLKPRGIEPIWQVVVPGSLREMVLTTAHDETGHMGIKKTYDRIVRHCYWPRVKRAVTSHVKTCHVCQLTGKPNQVPKPVPLRPIVPAPKPFEHLVVDCVGPLPRSKSGCLYLLTVMCQTTRYPAAYPLRSITVKPVVKALSQFISIFGLPKIIQTDRGSNFTSKMFSQVLRVLKVTHNTSSARHPQSQGVLERFHQTYKSMLRSYCVELGGDWEEGLPWLLLAIREVTQTSTGFSPNELVFGHTVRGQVSSLFDGCLSNEPPQTLTDYVNGFRRRLFMAGRLAMEQLRKSQRKMKQVYDRKTELRSFKTGDLVMVLLPVVSSPFQARYAGPYKILRCYRNDNYVVATPDRKRRTQRCHANLLKLYHSRDRDTQRRDTPNPALDTPALTTESNFDRSPSCMVSCVAPPPAVAALEEPPVCEPDDAVLLGKLNNSESLANLPLLLSHLTPEQAAELGALIKEFPSLFSDTPTQTDLISHDIDVGNAPPVRQRFYRVSGERRQLLENEVRYLMDNDLAERSYSSWTSPCILVKKANGSNRFCTDYRKLNSVTKPDSFPLPRMEDCVDQVGSAKFVTKIDLLKGYWQIPLTQRAREVSSFVTPSGLYSYKVMPFGLRNAAATFQRLMNQVVANLDGCAVYLDDAVTYSDTWTSHLDRLRQLFSRLAQAKLTVNLAKCEFARATVTYLGKVVGQGSVRPVRSKVLAIDALAPPANRRQLMSFLGMVGYYRSFCPNFSSVVAPLTNLLKKGQPFEWTAVCQTAFAKAKAFLTSEPLLAAPRLDRPFKLQVDASKVGAGAVLLQDDVNGVEHPVCYFSRKFNSYQLHYSTIEKEALALVWALQTFEVYLGGSAEPIHIYCDHNPLVFLQSLQNPNQRLMRWSLFLQPYNLRITHIKGRENVTADPLSRSPAP